MHRIGLPSALGLLGVNGRPRAGQASTRSSDASGASTWTTGAQVTDRLTQMGLLLGGVGCIILTAQVTLIHEHEDTIRETCSCVRVRAGLAHFFGLLRLSGRVVGDEGVGTKPLLRGQTPWLIPMTPMTRQERGNTILDASHSSVLPHSLSAFFVPITARARARGPPVLRWVSWLEHRL